MPDKQTLYIMNRLEQKLIELMGKEEYGKFSTEVAREAFQIELNGMADGDFKDFCLENFDKITGGGNTNE